MKGWTVIFDVMYGSEQPAGALYFFDRPEYQHIKIGSHLLLQTIKKGTEDPFINAAMIHNEFARGHQFDKDFGLLFCRLYMNLALILTGHVPAIIDSSKKDEYLQLTQSDNLSNPQALASFLVKRMNETYQKYILPILEDGVPYYIDLDSKLDYLKMMSEHILAHECFDEGNFQQAKIHIETAKKCALALDGITPLIMGTHIIRLSKFEKNIDMKLRDALAQDEIKESTTKPTALHTESENKHSRIATFVAGKIKENIALGEQPKSNFRPLNDAQKMELQRALQEAEESINKFSAY